ncbi:LuxR C-terminal-related transcriptional regulator [Conexibacter woesei]|uniref:Two component transcriptional regulator, LuxR family n=1 Tax=Conexibacter woesei (strain DSM 14684 / CCUG 47730 / CIP 108061 / JCM 11494 / NBRC 100937 / ID131577) TaxID=469383 RepID=D3F8I3_CONWI|nr:response regulator transcription factor [Conexibacter woesei]ADB50947.1 two component transcriptional regulator, LuxR family [Conexibacter woesei DSM 14684]
MTAAAITTVLIDDHTIFRSGLRELLAEHGLVVEGDAPTVAAGVQLVERCAPDVAIVDLDLPDGSGIDAIRRIAECAPGTAVLVLTVSEADDDLTDAVLAGGCGYLLKDAPIETIVAGVTAVAAGDAVLSPRVAATMLARMRASGRQTAARARAQLSPREQEVLRLVAGGMDNAAIAQELFISPHTVKNHISSILTKLHVANRIQAAVRAVRDEIL